MHAQETTNWEGRTYTVDFTDIFPDGRAGGDAGGRMAVSLGALPGEQAQVRVAKHRRGQLLCDVLSLTGKSAERMEPREEHYRWCSPWQIASYDTQLRYKQQLITRSFAGTGIGEVLVTPSPDQWKYRTRIEFGILSRQVLKKRRDSIEQMIHAVATWRRNRNRKRVTIDWKFTTKDARKKFKYTRQN